MDFLNLDALLRQALSEDLGRGDITTDSLFQERKLTGAEPVFAEAIALAKEEMIVSGWSVFVRVFEQLGAVSAKREVEEGVQIREGQRLGILRAEAGLLLKGERVALNLLQRMCGIATLTRRYVERVEGTRAVVVDTRKTTPLWRALEKYSVRVGGGRNHRMGLDDAVLIKDNHIAIAGGIRNAVEACRQRVSHLHKIEVEVTGLEGLEEAIESGADVVMLDNMNPEEVREAVQFANGRCLLEVSGGITLETIREYAETGVDLISSGALTHSFKSSDISLEIQPQ